MKIYRFDAESREFLYAEESALDPLESVAQGREVWLLPVNSTFMQPPADKAGYVPLWLGDSWELVEDHRQKQDKNGEHPTGQGTPYWMPGDTWNTMPHYMDKPGPLPEGAMREAPAKPAEVVEAERLSRAKEERTEAVAAITVTVDGMVFDGDEKAQERMSRTVTAATATGASMDDTTVWVLHDNTVATPTIRQLATALRLAGEEQTRLWTIPYEASYTPAEAA